MHHFISRMILIFILVVGCMCQLYERIPKYHVGAFMQDYLESREINDCFYTILSASWDEHGGEELSLKCLRNGELVTLLLKIEPIQIRKTGRI